MNDGSEILRTPKYGHARYPFDRRVYENSGYVEYEWPAPGTADGLETTLVEGGPLGNCPTCGDRLFRPSADDDRILHTATEQPWCELDAIELAGEIHSCNDGCEHDEDYPGQAQDEAARGADCACRPHQELAGTYGTEGVVVTHDEYLRIYEQAQPDRLTLDHFPAPLAAAVEALAVEHEQIADQYALMTRCQLSGWQAEAWHRSFARQLRGLLTGGGR